MERCDLVVLGGGPAGAISALLAAREGLSVVLADPGTPRPVVEGMSPRLHAWLQGQGLLAGFGGLFGPLPREVHWAGRRTTRNAEFLVDRPALDRHLRQAARSAGARLLCAAGTPAAGVADLGPHGRVEARHVIDARGRAGLGRAGARRAPFATLSLCGWLAPARPVAPGLRIAALASGWTWIAVLPDGRIWAQFTCDARAEAGIAERLLEAAAEALPEAGHLELLQDRPLAREAAPVLPRPTIDLDVLSVGDAFATMDPLAGQGQFWAVSGALAAAAVRRTRDARPGPETDRLCRRFLDHRAREASLRNARVGRDFLRMETRLAGAPFWAARRDFPDSLPAHEVTAVTVAPDRPAVRNGLIVAMDVLLTPEHPGGVAWFGDTPAAEAWSAASGKARPA